MHGNSLLPGLISMKQNLNLVPWSPKGVPPCPCAVQPGGGVPVWDRHPDTPVLCAAKVSLGPGRPHLWGGAGAPWSSCYMLRRCLPLASAPITGGSQVHLFAFLKTSVE